MHLPDHVCPARRRRPPPAARRALWVALCCASLLSAARAAAQRIDIDPSIGDVGCDAAVTVSGGGGEALPGVAVRARHATGEEIELGETDAGGAVVFRPRAEGRYELRAVLADGVLLIAPYQVEPQRRRWLWASICVPVGLLLLWRNVRAARHRTRA